MTSRFKSLDEAKKAVIAAHRRGDMTALREAEDGYRAVARARRRSQENIQRDAEGYGPGGSALEGYGASGLNLLRRTARVLTPKAYEDKVGRALNLTDRMSLDDTISEQQRLDAKGSGAFTAGKFVGDIVNTAPIGGGVGAGIRAAGTAATGAKAGMLMKSLANAGEGAAAGHLTAGDAGTGAVFGAASLPAMRILGHTGRAMAAGVRRTKDADALLRHGAKLDLGQMNPGGWVDRAIKAAENAPAGLGAHIRGARDAAIRPVVPNLAADMAGIARPSASKSARAGIDDALSATEKKFTDVDAVGLDPQSAAQVKAGAQGRRLARRKALEDEMDVRAEKRGALDDAEKAAESALLKNEVALENATDPRIIKALKTDRKVLEARLGQAQINKGRYNPSLGELRQKGRDAAALHKSDLQRQALNAARSKFLVPKDRKRIEKAISEQISKLGDGELTPTKMKAIASKLKQDARRIRGGANQNADTLRQAEAYNNAAAFLERRIKASLKAGGKDVGAYVDANRRFGGLKILEQGVFDTGATPHGLINPHLLESALKSDLGPRRWVAGKGGEVRNVTEALKRLEMSQFGQGGQFSAAANPHILSKVIQGTMGIPLSSKTLGYVGRGEHMLGRSLRGMGPKKKRLIKTLGLAYHGTPGALTGYSNIPDEEE